MTAVPEPGAGSMRAHDTEPLPGLALSTQLFHTRCVFIA